MNQSFTKSKLLRFKNFKSFVFDNFLSKTQKISVLLLALSTLVFSLYILTIPRFDLLFQDRGF